MRLFGPLFAVPKKRLTLNVRQRRRAGLPQWAPHGLKLLTPKSDIVACQTCGHYHQLQYLCDKCYERVKQASKPIQDAIVRAFAGQAVQQEVHVLYRGEEPEQAASTSTSTNTGLRFVEVDEERPPWFTRNLMSRTNGRDLPSEPMPGDQS